MSGEIGKGKIRVLDAAMANQIAAGEVIENPASVVKELIENSLDAGAGRVTVMLDGHATDVMRVVDDGEGMSAADAALALERHATSKIRSPEDLTNITTLGFRGEALPSIASVSKLSLSTKLRGEVAGTTIVSVPGEPLEVKPAGTPEGTRIEVRDLFFNTPARRKFLKSSAAETARITEQVVRQALSRPGAAFSLVRNGKQTRSFLPRSELGERVQEVIGAKVALRHASGQLGPVAVDAWVTGPDRSRVGARGLHLLVNGRLVRDPGLLRAIWVGYDGTLDQGHYPLGVVAVTLDPHRLDVNVHPQKAEVRFVDRGAVQAAVIRVVGTAVKAHVHPAQAGPASSPPLDLKLPPQAPEEGKLPFPAWPRAQASGAGPPGPGAPVIPPHPGGGSLQTPPHPLVPAGPPAAGLAAPAGPAGVSYASLRYLGSAGHAWLVCEGPDGLVVIDQHAAHERITFERLRASYNENKPKAQKLLVPEQVEVSAAELDELTERGDELRAIGFEVEPFSTTSVTITAVPAPLSRADPRRLLDEVLGELSGLRAPLADSMDKLLARLACHGSVRGGSRLSREEVEALLQAMDEAEHGGHCPHGRPVSLHLSWAEVERRLGRR